VCLLVGGAILWWLSAPAPAVEVQPIEPTPRPAPAISTPAAEPGTAEPLAEKVAGLYVLPPRPVERSR